MCPQGAGFHAEPSLSLMCALSVCTKGFAPSRAISTAGSAWQGRSVSSDKTEF